MEFNSFIEPDEDTQRTLVLIKPDAVRRGLIGEIVSRFERRNIQIVAMKKLLMSMAQAEIHYAQLKSKPFFPDVVGFITSGPVVAMVLKGHNVVDIVREMMGPTDGGKAQRGTIRGDLCASNSRNVIHGSDSIESANREIANFFNEDEICAW